MNEFPSSAQASAATQQSQSQPPQLPQPPAPSFATVVTQAWSSDRLKLDAIGVLALCVLTIVAWVTAVRPVRAARQQAAADRDAYVAVHDRLTELGTNVAAARETLAAATRERGLPLLPASRLNHRLVAINDLSASSDARLDDVQPARAIAGERYDLLPIHVVGSGNYAALVAFLHRLHATCPDVAVGALTVTGTPSPTTRPVTFTLDLAWYTRGTASAAAKAPAPK